MGKRRQAGELSTALGLWPRGRLEEYERRARSRKKTGWSRKALLGSFRDAPKITQEGDENEPFRPAIARLGVLNYIDARDLGVSPYRRSF